MGSRLLILLLLALLPLGHMRSKALAQTEELASINFAYATWIGSGYYRLAGRKLYVLRIPAAIPLRSMNDDHWGVNLLLPVPPSGAPLRLLKTLRTQRCSFFCFLIWGHAVCLKTLAEPAAALLTIPCAFIGPWLWEIAWLMFIPAGQILKRMRPAVHQKQAPQVGGRLVRFQPRFERYDQ